MKKLYLTNFFIFFLALTTFGQGWVVYTADSLPGNDPIGFSESNVDGDPATNTLVMDVDHPGNSLLELVSPGADPAKFMWKHNLPNDVNDPITLVARVRKVSDTLDRTMEFDFRQGGFRERLFLRNNGEYELKEAGVREDLPVGVMGWHIYRITKDTSEVKFYIDEDPEPIDSVTTDTEDSNNYWRFGDGNGSSTLGGLVDWIIWDTTGAYAPGDGAMIPDSLVVEVASTDASLSALTSSAGTLMPAFSSDVMEYMLVVPRGTASVTLTATPNDANASAQGDGEITEIPGTATITVTAEDGFKMTYQVVLKVLPDWVVYTADSIPGNDPIGFSESNVDGDPATNIILVDTENPGNNLLELISPGADPSKFMWKHNFPNDVNDPVTLVARVKKVSDTLDRTMEFDFRQGGFRERLYLRNNGEYEFKEAGVREDLPVGVMGWHLYRITKDSSVVKFYIDEDPEPVDSVTTDTDDSNNYWRFGDGNGSSTLGGLVDWIIWDTVGAYPPGDMSVIPDSLITDVSSSDATLSSLTSSVGGLMPGFDADSTEYVLKVVRGTETVTLTATANDVGASVEGDGEITEIPGTATITVTAEDGFKKAYTVDIMVMPDWVVYTADSVPGNDPIGFSESNVDGDPATNAIVVDTEHPGNNLLELISPGADPSKFMWKHNLPNDVSDPITLVARVRKVSDTLDRTMEFDFRQGGFRERLYLRNNGEYEFKEAGIRTDLPVGVMGWHIYRITKDTSEVKFYIDEDPEPVDSVTTDTQDSNNYWRFGDGNGSSTLGGLVDWIIWDTTGAYAPGEMSMIPDSLVQDVTASDAALSGLSANTGTLTPAFDPATMEYDLVLAAGTPSVTITATPSDPEAAVEGDGEFSTFPDTVMIEVTAQDGYTMMYQVNIEREATGMRDTRSRLARIYPNPAADMITVEYRGSGEATIMVYDMLGKMVMSRIHDADVSTLNISGLEQGIYLIRVSDGDISEIQRFMKE
jgi:hypothetical protein